MKRRLRLRGLVISKDQECKFFRHVAFDKWSVVLSSAYIKKIGNILRAVFEKRSEIWNPQNQRGFSPFYRSQYHFFKSLSVFLQNCALTMCKKLEQCLEWIIPLLTDFQVRTRKYKAQIIKSSPINCVIVMNDR